MDYGLKGKTALVTGAASGVGYAVASRLLSEGARVVLADIRLEAAQAAVADLEQLGEVVAVHMDVRSLDSVQGAFGEAEAAMGGAIELSVNNAGDWVDKPFLDTTPADWAHDLDLNLQGAINCTHTALRSMVAAGQGSIVSVVSEAARVGEPRGATYSAAKAGVVAMTKALAKEFGPSGVRLNNVALAATVTPRLTRDADEELRGKMARRYPLRRLGTPDDAADAIVFLLSDRASWVTGQTYGVNGGYVTP